MSRAPARAGGGERGPGRAGGQGAASEGKGQAEPEAGLDTEVSTHSGLHGG